MRPSTGQGVLAEPASRLLLVDPPILPSLIGPISTMRILTAFAFDIHFRQYGRCLVVP
jgi:hypothetical protein